MSPLAANPPSSPRAYAQQQHSTCLLVFGLSSIDIVGYLAFADITRLPIANLPLAKLGILPKKRVDLLSTSPNNNNSASRSGSSSLGINTATAGNKHDNDDPNPGLPGASHDLVSKIPKTPPASERDRYRLEDSDDDELEYTK
jgi:hypothetical protein